MIRTAWLALGLVCLLLLLPRLPDLLLVPEIIAVFLGLIFVFRGALPAMMFVPMAWTVLASGWTIENSLPAGFEGQDVILRGVICDFPRRDDRVSRFVFDVRSDQYRGRLYLSWYNVPVILKPGEAWQLKVRLRSIRGSSNPGAFDYERWAFARGITAGGSVRKSVTNRHLANDGVVCRLGRWRSLLADKIEQHLGNHPGAPIVMALALGARQQLSVDDWGILRRTGTVHLMAISGLHIGLVAGLCILFGRRLGRLALWLGLSCSPAFTGCGLALLAAAVYSALAGFAVPTIRALIMVAMAILAVSLRRCISGWDIFAAALFLVLLVEPTATLSGGFWLSFAGVGVLMLQGAGLSYHGPKAISAWQAGRISVFCRAQLALMIGLAPLAIGLFGQLAWLGPLANIFAIPVFAGFIVPLTLTGSLLLMVNAVPAGWLLWLAAEASAAVMSLLGWLDRVSGPVWVPPGAPDWVVLPAALAALMLLWPRPMPLRFLGPFLLFPMLFGVSGNAPEEGYRVVVMDVGQGLAVLIQTENHALLYDTGPRFGNSNAGDRIVIPVLRNMGISHLDVMVISHGDQDHRGGAEAVLEAYPDAALIATRSFGLSPKSFRRCGRGLEWRWDGIRFRFLHPDTNGHPDRWSDNDGSCVLLVEGPSGSLLLPGDIEHAAENYLLEQAVLRPVDVVIAPHHGSATSSGPSMVAQLKPRYVVFAAASGNRWGFPRADVQQRWSAVGACLLTVGDTGALIFESAPAGALELHWRNRLDARRFWTRMPDSQSDCGMGRAL